MKKGVFICCLLSAFGCYARAQEKTADPAQQPADQTQQPAMPALADSLSQWAVLDQTAAGPRQGRFKDMTSADRTRYSDSVFSLNENRLKAIFDRYGFPGYDLVGEKGSNAFWLMAQHCDKDVAFQEKVLAAMREQVTRHNADPKNFAYLTDRVRINTGQKQVYGTQVTYNLDSCQAVPKPLEDSLLVDKKRNDIGLEPLEAYLNWMSEAHFEMNKAIYEKKGIHHAKLIPEPN